MSEKAMEANTPFRFPFAGKAACPCCEKTRYESDKIEYIGTFVRERSEVRPGEYTKMHGYRCRECDKCFSLYEI